MEEVLRFFVKQIIRDLVASCNITIVIDIDNLLVKIWK